MARAQGMGMNMRGYGMMYNQASAQGGWQQPYPYAHPGFVQPGINAAWMGGGPPGPFPPGLARTSAPPDEALINEEAASDWDTGAPTSFPDMFSAGGGAGGLMGMPCPGSILSAQASQALPPQAGQALPPRGAQPRGMPPPPPRAMGGGGGLSDTHTILRLSAVGNETAFKTIEVRAAIAKTVKWLAKRAGAPEPDMAGFVVTEAGAGTGPYFPTLKHEEARFLLDYGTVTI